MSNPVCKLCGKSGFGVQFSLTSPQGFGNACTDCDSAVSELRSIVQKRNLFLLEDFCTGKTYQQVQAFAQAGKLDLEELEEQLADI